MGYSVAYNVEQSVSMVPPCLVLIEALMYEMVGVLWPWTKKAKLDHKKAKIKYFIMIGYYVAAMLCWWQCDIQGPVVETCKKIRVNAWVMTSIIYRLLAGCQYAVSCIIAKGDHHPREINYAVFAKMTPFVLFFVKMSTALFCYKGTLIS